MNSKQILQIPTRQVLQFFRHSTVTTKVHMEALATSATGGVLPCIIVQTQTLGAGSCITKTAIQSETAAFCDVASLCVV